jgi:SAM-dependent methyltransferase
MINHNIKNGYIKFCQICGNKNIKKVLDLGFQPLADDLRSINLKNIKTEFFPLEIGFCSKCVLLQNNYIVDEKKLYKKNYHYRPGITKAVTKNFEEMSKKIVNLYELNSESVVADIGCNDGSLLKEFKKKKIYKLIGIDPTDTIKYAKKIGIKTVQAYMNKKSAYEARNFYGQADIITTTNVFAHTNKLGDFINGIKQLIKKNGVFIIENHYLLDVIKKRQFDSFYHEHLRTYSLTSLIKLLSYYKFYPIDSYASERYGGNIQVHFSQVKNKTTKNLTYMLVKEKKYKLNKIQTYKKFKEDIYKVKMDIEKYLNKNKNKKIVAKAFPARASVLLHFFDSIKNSISFIAEQPSSLKLNKYAPGTKIKIISSNNLNKYKPDIMIILAWHLFTEIKKKWKAKLKKTKFLKILPRLKVY